MNFVLLTAPVGVRKPVINPLSESELRVSWLAPKKPNGQITAYNVIIEDRKIYTNQTIPSSIVLDDLEPYTIYHLKVIYNDSNLLQTQ